jgi:hypothetical protein
MRAEIPQVTALFPDHAPALPTPPAVSAASALSGVQGVPGSRTDPGALPVLPALAGLLPAGLPRGSVIATGAWGLLCLALAAAASGAGAWCAVAGLPALGVAAAAGAGLDPDRLLLVPDPGSRWPHVVATLLDGCDLVVLRPPSRPSAALRRKLESVARRYGGVLVIAGDWDGAHRRLTVTSQEWAGIGPGHGRLRARRAQVVVDGRGAAGRPRARWLWLPGPDGSVAPVVSSTVVNSTVVSSGLVASSGPAAGSEWAAAFSPDPGEPAEAPLWRGRSAG